MKSQSFSPTETKRVFISDCEGPISKNDNAFELTSHYIPNGSRLFTLISRYDDILADLIKRSAYKAGDTLKLILPFFKAYEVTNKDMMDYSSQTVLFIPTVEDTLRYVCSFMPFFIVSTSYEQYMQALCNLINFPFENVYCTRLDLDKYEIGEEEKKRLKKLAGEIVEMSIPEVPKDAKTLEDLPLEQRETVKRLDEIFWQEIPTMQAGVILKEVNPVGGVEKAQIIEEVIRKLKGSIYNVMYVGDSITDVEAFRLVREGGGLTISFNGNAYAIREAEVAVMSENSVITAVLASAFNRFGKNEVIKLVSDWDTSTLTKNSLLSPLEKRFFQLKEKRLPLVEVVTQKNMDKLMKESTSFRKRVRGEAVGKLG
jgi:energy-converting hydrogenase A subunit R